MQREKIARISAIVYVAILALSAMVLSSDGTNVPIYAFLAVVSLVPLIWGRGYGRVIGIVALMAALSLAVHDYRNGLALEQCMRAIRQDMEASATRETPPADQQSPINTRVPHSPSAAPPPVNHSPFAGYKLV